MYIFWLFTECKLGNSNSTSEIKELTVSLAYLLFQAMWHLLVGFCNQQQRAGGGAGLLATWGTVNSWSSGVETIS